MTDDLFSDEQLVEPPRSNLSRVLLALIGVGVLVAGAVVVVAVLITSITPSGPKGGELTLAEVESLTALSFPDGTTVTSSNYTSSSARITVDAQLTLPAGADNPFADSAYFPVDEPGFDWTTDELTDVSYFAASGELDTLTADGLFASNADSHRVVFVHLTRVLG